MRKINWHILFEKRPSFHRWFYLVFAIIYIALMYEDLEHPFSRSSLYVPYYILVIVPTLVLLTHFVFTRLVTWWSVIILFVILFFPKSINAVSNAWIWSHGPKKILSDFYFTLYGTILLFALNIWILYITRSRKSTVKDTSNNS